MLKDIKIKIVLGSFIFGYSLYAQGVGLNVNVHGFVSQGYLKSDHNNFLADSKDGSFEVNEAGVNFMTQVNEDLRVGLQLFSRDLGEESNNNVILDWAYGDYHWRDYLGIRMGKIKAPVGLYNVNRDVNFVRTSILLPQGVYDEMQRDFSLAHQGIELYGNLSSTRGFKLCNFDYEFYFGTLTIPNSDSPYWKWALNDLGRVFFKDMKDDVEYGFSNNNVTSKYIYGGALKWHSPIQGVNFSTTMMRGKLNLMTHLGLTIPPLPALETDVDIDITFKSHDVYSCEINVIDNLTLTAEYLKIHYFGAMTAMGDFIIKEETDMHGEGYYGQAAYRLNDFLTIGYYYNRYFANTKDRKGKTYIETGLSDFVAWQHDHCVTLRFDLTNNWCLKAENHFINGVNQASRFDNPDGLMKNWQLFAIKTSYYF